ncbi:glycosyl transferase [Paenibacillus sp. PR3]|uniref:Glycosyl transferase n=2 Tax=Paenibacillus terricola TaxID=2763503 RepID=A0ABR8MZY0_9BACL|nr:glycosyl transferase [Paenibacillus terricola]
MGKKLNLNDPQTFNEKLQWLKLYDRNPLYTRLVDKYEVRKYIAETIGEQYLIPLLGVWNSFDEIDFERLPNQFVLKCTHDSGGLVICKDKSKLDLKQARRKINHCIKKNYFYNTREWPYKNVKPRIIAEQFIKDDIDDDLKDYKLICFNGEVKCTFVCTNRHTGAGLHMTFYDNDWRVMPFERHYPKESVPIRRPAHFEKMKEIAEQLSSRMALVRIDFYEVKGKLYFGEVTFYPGSGFEEFTPDSYDYLLGSWINLSKVHQTT